MQTNALSAYNESYFLIWKANRRIPNYEEAAEIVTTFGLHFDGGMLVRKA